jgi:hypothetical protein
MKLFANMKLNFLKGCKFQLDCNVYMERNPEDCGNGFTETGLVCLGSKIWPEHLDDTRTALSSLPCACRQFPPS